MHKTTNTLAAPLPLHQHSHTHSRSVTLCLEAFEDSAFFTAGRVVQVVLLFSDLAILSCMSQQISCLPTSLFGEFVLDPLHGDGLGPLDGQAKSTRPHELAQHTNGAADSKKHLHQHVASDPCTCRCARSTRSTRRKAASRITCCDASQSIPYHAISCEVLRASQPATRVHSHIYRHLQGTVCCSVPNSTQHDLSTYNLTTGPTGMASRLY